MKVRCYSSYIESGVSWLGEIPDHWCLSRLKFVATVKSSNVDKHAKENEVSVRLCNYVDVYYNNQITDNLPFMNATATQDEVERFGLKSGDVLITKDSESRDDIGIPAYMPESLEDLVCGYHLAMIRPAASRINDRYLFYLLSSDTFNYQFKVSANGVTRFGLPKSAINNALMLVPPIEDQQAIAIFLDRETARIDALIEKKRRLLELLEEKRLAVITRAVTKGLDPGVPKKDSGVEWLGEIPAHWGATRLRFILSDRLKNGLFKKSIEWGHGCRVINVYDVYAPNDLVDEQTLDRVVCSDEEKEKYSAEHGDFFFVRSSLKLEGVGKSASLVNPQEKLVFECHLVRGRPDLEKINPRFLGLYLNARHARGFLISRANAVTMATIDQIKFKDLYITFPRLEEQNLVVEFVDSELRKLQKVRVLIDRAIQRLDQYRSTLVTNAVTGKIDVRHLVKDEAAA